MCTQLVAVPRLSLHAQSLYTLWHEILTEKLVWWIGGCTYERPAKSNYNPHYECINVALEMCIHSIKICPPNYYLSAIFGKNQQYLANPPNITPFNIFISYEIPYLQMYVCTYVHMSHDNYTYTVHTLN